MKNKFTGTGEQGYRPLRKIKTSIHGIYCAVILDFAVAYKVVTSIIFLAIAFYYRQWLDFSIILVSTGVMIISEMFNTAVEAICDFVEKNYNENIGLIKDIAAGAVGVSIFIWFVVIVIETVRVYTHMMNFK